MEHGSSDPATAARRRPLRRVQTWLFTLALLALAGGTAAGFLVARARAVDDVDQRLVQDARRASRALETEVREVTLLLSGANVVLGRDGVPDLDAFRAYADDVVASGTVPAVALVAVVENDERAEFEARTGTPLRALVDGELVPAPTADVHYPIVAIAPDTLDADAVGVDLAMTPVGESALAAAAAGTDTVVGGLSDLQRSGDPRALALRPLGTDAAGPASALVATGIPGSRLAEAIAPAAERDVEAAVVEGDAIVIGPPDFEVDGATVVPASVAGRSWDVAVRTGAGPDLTVAWLIAIGGTLATLVMAALVVVTERNQKELARANQLLRRGERQTSAVQDLAGRLARSLSGREIVTALLDHLPAAAGARSAALATVDENGALVLLRPNEPGGVDEQTSALDRDSLVGEIIGRGRPAWLSSSLEWRDDATTAELAAGGSALALLPLAAEDVAGVLAVSYPRVHIFADDERALLETVGVLASRALARGRQYDAEHQTALAFQRAALPDDLPTVPGIRIAARYRPAAAQATVGGDWYDVIVLDDRRVMVVVGDVVGHGIEAAAAMGRIRTAFQAIASLTTDPGEMLRSMSTQVDSIPNAFCTTVVCAVVDLDARTLTWSRAGHPPPLLLGTDGPRLLEEPGAPPLGVVPDLDPPMHCTPLAPDDTVVLYTDGLIERRGEFIDDGFDRLGVVAQDLADLDPESFGDALVEALVPADQQTDDLALLVFRLDAD